MEQLPQSRTPLQHHLAQATSRPLVKSKRDVLSETRVAAKLLAHLHWLFVASWARPEGTLTLQGAGAKLRGIPWLSEATTEQRVTGIGALQRFLEAFPEFVIQGKAPKATVRLA